MDGSESFLHVVGREEVHNASKLQKEVVLETKDRCRSHNGGLGIDATSDLLAAGL